MDSCSIYAIVLFLLLLALLIWFHFAFLSKYFGSATDNTQSQATTTRLSASVNSPMQTYIPQIKESVSVNSPMQTYIPQIKQSPPSGIIISPVKNPDSLLRK